MEQINFTKKVNLEELASFAKTKNFDNEILLRQAFNKGFLVDEKKILLEKFIDHFRDKKNIKSQLYQDVFASFIIGNKFDKTFLEFGATNGLDLSNTFMLESSFGWKGVLSEPSPQWHTSLKENRKNSKIITKCIWTESNKKLDFFESDAGEYSTLNDYLENDIKSMPGNTKLRKKSGKLIKVETISLNDVIKNYFQNKAPSYISIDTEGSEYEIIKSFNFKKYRPQIFTIEHNHTKLEKKIDDILKHNNYERIFRKLTAFDGWYVNKEALNNI